MDLEPHKYSKKEISARDFLYQNFKAENELYFGNNDERWLSDVCDAWMNDESNSRHRYDTMRSIIGDKKLKKSRILDMSSGCGTFVFYGLMNGYDVYGIEPSEWKHKFNRLKAKEKGYPGDWIKRFSFGVGEHLPFNDETFDIISTYQTLEHVKSHQKCFDEFKRVLKKGGALFIQCPDYKSFYEGHYRLPILPLMSKCIFKIYVKLLKKPTKGLDTINYITNKMVLSYLKDYHKVDKISLLKIRTNIYNKTKINSQILCLAYLLYCYIKRLFRRENSINLVAVKNA